MKSVLSTKILTASQKARLLNANISFVAYDSIKIDFAPFQVDENDTHYIFTSKNAIASFLAQNSERNLSNHTTFCVGDKTEQLLQENGLRVVEKAENATKLGQIIAKKYKNQSFTFFSGNLRRNELPEFLKKNNIRYKEIVVYHTTFNPKKFDGLFDGILFFSPSGVQSHLQLNELRDSLIFCIGETTAAEAKKHTKNIVVANKPTVENVLVQAIKQLK